MEINNLANLISNLATKAATNTSLSNVIILFAPVEDRRWRTNSQKSPLLWNRSRDILLGCQSRLWTMGLVIQGLAGRYLRVSGSKLSGIGGSSLIRPQRVGQLLTWCNIGSICYFRTWGIEGVTVRVCSSSDWKAVNTPKTTFWGVPRVSYATGVALRVIRGTY